MRKIRLLTKYKYFAILVLSAVFSMVWQSSIAQSQTFTTNGTFTVPAGVTSITVECWGGGGAGGRATENGNNDASGGGGAGGAYARKTLNVDANEVYTINVAASKISSTSSDLASNNNGNSSSVLLGTIEMAKAVGGAGGGGSSDKANNRVGIGGSGSASDAS